MSAVPPLPLVRSRAARPKRAYNYAQDCTFKEYVFFAIGARLMDVSMVIAAWGEGVGLLVSPSPSSDRSSIAKTRVKIAGWVLRHAPSAAHACAPPHAKDVKYDRNIEANL
jgi:hypothetical protein